jgi:hypothetical protein
VSPANKKRAVRNVTGGGALDSSGDRLPRGDYATRKLTQSAAAEEVNQAAAADIVWFAFQDDGWLRIIPAPDDLAVHLKWKFNAGQHAGYYVYVHGYVSHLPMLLSVLRRKVEGTRSGEFRPTKDTAYDR